MACVFIKYCKDTNSFTLLKKKCWLFLCYFFYQVLEKMEEKILYLFYYTNYKTSPYIDFHLHPRI